MAVSQEVPRRLAITPTTNTLSASVPAGGGGHSPLSWSTDSLINLRIFTPHAGTGNHTASEWGRPEKVRLYYKPAVVLVG